MIGLLGYATYQYAEPALSAISLVYPRRSPVFSDATQRGIRLVETVIAACWMIGIASSASSGLTSEREGDTWISLTRPH